MDNLPPDTPPLAPPAGPGDPGSPAALTDDDRNFAVLTHLLGVFTGFVGPLVIWLLKKDDSPFVDAESKESLNFQITLLIAYATLGVAVCLTAGLAVFLVPVLVIAGLVFPILGAFKVKDGLPYRYPLTIRLLK